MGAKNRTYFVYGFVLSIFLLGVPLSALGQSLKDVYLSMKKLDSKIQIGVTYVDYFRMLGDIKFEAEKFLDSEGDRADQKGRVAVQETLNHYILLGQWWNHFMRGGQGDCRTARADVFPEAKKVKEVFSCFIKQYPKIGKVEAQGGAKTSCKLMPEDIPDPSPIPPGLECFSCNLGFNIIWTETSASLKKIKKIMDSR